MRALFLCLLLCSTFALAQDSTEICGYVKRTNDGVRFQLERPDKPQLEISDQSAAGQELIQLANSAPSAFEVRATAKLVFTLAGTRKVLIEDLHSPTQHDATVRVHPDAIELADGKRATAIGPLAKLLLDLKLPGVPVEVKARTLSLQTGEVAVFVNAFKALPTESTQEFTVRDGDRIPLLRRTSPLWIDREPQAVRVGDGEELAFQTGVQGRITIFVPVDQLVFVDAAQGGTCVGLGACLERAQR